MGAGADLNIFTSCQYEFTQHNLESGLSVKKINSRTWELGGFSRKSFCYSRKRSLEGEGCLAVFENGTLGCFSMCLEVSRIKNYCLTTRKLCMVLGLLGCCGVLQSGGAKWEAEPACSGLSPGLPGLLGGRQRELFPKKSPRGDLEATRWEFRDGGSCPSARPSRLAGHPPIASLLPLHLPSLFAVAPRTVARPGPHPFSVPLLRSLTRGVRCPVHLVGTNPVPQILKILDLPSWDTLTWG